MLSPSAAVAERVFTRLAGAGCQMESLADNWRALGSSAPVCGRKSAELVFASVLQAASGPHGPLVLALVSPLAEVCSRPQASGKGELRLPSHFFEPTL